MAKMKEEMIVYCALMVTIEFWNKGNIVYQHQMCCIDLLVCELWLKQDVYRTNQ